MKTMRYEEARGLMCPGDMIAFGGKGRISGIIKLRTLSPVSHVGVILQTRIGDEERYFNQIIESTSLSGFNGVVTSRVSDRVSDYEGNIWWLPLSEASRRVFDEKAFFDFLFAQIGKPYDTRQAIWSAIDWIPFLRNRENFEKMFCSELLAAGYKAAGLVDVNCSEVTPIDACRWGLYGEPYQLKGEARDIPGFNKKATL